MKIKSIYLIFIVSLFSGAGIYGQTYTGDQKDIDQILKNIKAFSSYVVASEYDSIASAYTADGKIMPGGTLIIEGHEKIRDYWTLPEGTSTIHHEVNPEEIKIIGDHAYDYGYYNGATRKADGTEVTWKGKYIIVWKKENGLWKIYLDMWNRVN